MDVHFEPGDFEPILGYHNEKADQAARLANAKLKKWKNWTLQRINAMELQVLHLKDLVNHLKKVSTKKAN